MSDHKNVIELNGKLYDSATGRMVGDNAHHQPVIVAPNSGTNVDGFVKKPSHPAKVHHPSPAETKPRKTHEVGKHAARHTPTHSKTLVRKGLKMPAAHHHAPVEHKTDHQEVAHHSPRLARAKSVPKSPRISKFGPPSPHHFITKKHETLHVKASPNQLKQEHARIQHAESPIPNHNQILKEQLVAKAMNDARTDEPAHHKKAKKHRAARKLGVSPKIIHFGTATFAAVLLIGFIAYQNAPNISMRIASSKAGFNAQIPGYQPSGFGMSGPIQYGPGQVTLNFKSHTDDRNFHVTQRVSDWNSDALLNNFVTTNNKAYQTFQDKGRTIYIYEGNNATWVSGGVWYQIEGNASLSSDQLIRLASSI